MSTLLWGFAVVIFILFLRELPKITQYKVVRVANSGNVSEVKRILDTIRTSGKKCVYGGSLLMAAATRGDLALADIIFSRRQEMAISSRDMGMAVITAASRGQKDVLVFLIENGGDVNSTLGLTALMWAAKKGQGDCVQYLIERGADVAAKDKSGRTAHMYAEESGHSAVVGIMKSAKKIVAVTSPIATRYVPPTAPTVSAPIISDQNRLICCLWPISEGKNDKHGFMYRLSFIITGALVFMFGFICYFFLEGHSFYGKSIAGYVLLISATTAFAVFLLYEKFIPMRVYKTNPQAMLYMIIAFFLSFGLMGCVVKIHAFLLGNSELTALNVGLLIVYAYGAAVTSMMLLRTFLNTRYSFM